VVLGFKAGDAADETTPGYRIRKLLAIERLGAELEVARADVSDRSRMEEVVVRAEKRFGRIHGVIHAALVLNDGAMELKTLQAAEKVFAPKVRGTLVLKEIFEKRGLDFFAIFSSLVSVLGGKGQVDYCAASNFQDAFARAEQGKLAKRVVSIDWGAWRETGKARRAELSKGVHPANVLPDGMSTAEGLEAFAIVLGASMPQILVSPVPLQASSMPPRRAEPKTPLPPAEEPLTEGERVLAEIWRELLGLENMGVHDNFFELGADSVISLQFIARAKKEGFHFTNAQVFELQTVRELLSAQLRGDEEEA
jgi:NAD(P)-dependent dehydrogenase (short-subunit alcohol dehydrogenase family)